MNQIKGRPIYDDAGRLIGFTGYSALPRAIEPAEQQMARRMAFYRMQVPPGQVSGNVAPGVRTPYLPVPMQAESSQQDAVKEALIRFYTDEINRQIKQTPTAQPTQKKVGPLTFFSNLIDKLGL